MADTGRRRLPDPLEKRNILADVNASRERLIEYGNAYLDAESFDDAYNFFEKAGDAQGIEKVKRQAVEMGVAAILFNMLRSRATTVTRDDWVAAAENGMKRGKLAYAAQAFRKLGDEQKLQEVLAKIPGQKPAPLPETQGQ